MKKRRRSYSHDEVQSTLRIRRTDTAATHNPDSSRPGSRKQAGVAAGGASTRSITRWGSMDMTRDAISERLSKRGRHGYLTTEQEHLIIGYFCWRRLKHKAVDRAILIEFIRGILNIELLPQRISELCEKYGITLQTSMSRSSRMVDEETAQEAFDFVEEIRALGLQPFQLLFMDETGLWSYLGRRKTYHFKNWYALIIIAQLTTSSGNISSSTFFHSATLSSELQ